jgi:hypothetical protein
MRKISVVGLSVTTAFWFGCGGTGTSEGAGTDGGPEDAVPVVAVQGHVHAPDGTRLARADVCALGTSASSAGPCAKSDAEGSFTLSPLPANGVVSLTFNKNGFLPMLRTILTEEQDLLLPEDENTLIAATRPQSFLGVTADPTKGQMAFLVKNADGNAPAVDVTLTGFDGAPTPAALASDGTPAGSIAAGSGGGFANVTAGEYVLRVGGISATCTASDLYGVPITTYQPSSAAALALSVVAGYVSAPIIVSCSRLAP